jgi:hypothetical protein
MVTARFVRSQQSIETRTSRKMKKNKSKSGEMSINLLSSSSENRSGSSDSDERKFEMMHGIKDIGNKHLNRDKLVIKVQDTGVGIKRQDRLKLFKLFGKL